MNMIIRAHRISQQWVVYVSNNGDIGQGRGMTWLGALGEAIEDQALNAGCVRLHKAVEECHVQNNAESEVGSR
jgi:hypothetical protein